MQKIVKPFVWALCFIGTVLVIGLAVIMFPFALLAGLFHNTLRDTVDDWLEVTMHVIQFIWEWK